MRHIGDYADEMESIRIISDREVEALLAGHPSVDGALDELGAFLRSVRTTFVQQPSPELERAHLAAMAEAFQMVEPRRKKMLSTVLASVWMKVAAAVASAVVATGGLAAANALPGPAQDAVASVADHVGINLPSSDDQGEASDAQDNEGDSASEDHGKSVSTDVHAVLDDDSLEGRAKGDAVSDAASQNRQDGDAPGKEISDEQKNGDHGSDDAVENDNDGSDDESNDDAVESDSEGDSQDSDQAPDAEDSTPDDSTSE
jgi:hypothetical protein